MSNDEHDTDERFDRWLQEAARDYHRPPAEVPREEMWSAIAAARGAGVAPVPVQGDAAIARSAGGSRWSPRLWQMAAAAVLFLGTGIGIGRGLRPDAAPPAGSADATPVSPTFASADSAPAPQPAGGTSLPAPANGGRRGLAPRDASAASDASYARATVDHFARAEALLTSFKGTQGDSADVSLDKWARELLGDTRLLLDSPASSDSRRRHLLEDLELVLAQIVQLRAESSADRSLVRRSIERGEVLTRIRSTIPAGQSSGV